MLDECDALLGEPLFSEAKRSLARTNDGPKFARWMTQFLAQGVAPR